MASSTSHENESARRLAAIAGQLGMVTSNSVQVVAKKPAKHPQHEWRHLPSFRELPRQGGFPGCAWKVWGKNDQLGTVNLLTQSLVARTAKEEIRTGQTISLNWAAHLPLSPFFNRRAAQHNIWGKGGPQILERRRAVKEGMRLKGYAVDSRHDEDEQSAPISDDELHINTQSGTQWDGLRHYGHISLNCFYQGIPRKTIQDQYTGRDSHVGNESLLTTQPDNDAQSAASRLGIHNWAQHGIVGRGVLLDVWGYLWRKYGRAPYDPCSPHAISLETIKEVARAQGVRFRQGDILLLRLGFIQRYQNSTQEERNAWNSAPIPLLAGVEQGEDVAAWLWDNQYVQPMYRRSLPDTVHSFAAVASDQPAFERWPCPMESPFLHETLLG